jgi:hypothetical protein
VERIKQKHMSETKVKRVRMSMHLCEMTYLELIDFSNQVVLHMTGNIHFPSPAPTLAAIQAAITDLDNLVTAPKPLSTSQTADKKAKRKLLHDLLTALAAYVAHIANQDPPNAITIAESSGIPVAPPPKVPQNGFRVMANKIPGRAKLATTWVRNAAYHWEYTLTPADPASWKSYQGLYAKTTFTGLTSGLKYYFRVALIRKGIGPFSIVLSYVVL